MAFPAGTITTEDAWKEFRALATRLRRMALKLRIQSAAGETGRTSYINLQKALHAALGRWTFLIAAVPALEAYARDQINNPTLDLAAEYVLMRDATTSLRDWIFANMPRAPSDEVLTHKVGIDGRPIEQTFTVAQTAAFRVEVDAFVLTIVPLPT